MLLRLVNLFKSDAMLRLMFDRNRGSRLHFNSRDFNISAFWNHLRLFDHLRSPFFICKRGLFIRSVFISELLKLLALGLAYQLHEALISAGSLEHLRSASLSPVSSEHNRGGKLLGWWLFRELNHRGRYDFEEYFGAVRTLLVGLQQHVVAHYVDLFVVEHEVELEIVVYVVQSCASQVDQLLETRRCRL